MGHLSRARARETLDRFRAANAAQGSGPDRDAWIKEQTAYAGWEQ